MKLTWIRPYGYDRRKWFLHVPILPDVPLSEKVEPAMPLTRRLIRMGERKWQDYSQAPPASLTAQLYKAGKTLMDRLPQQEKMWWRLSNDLVHSEEGRIGAIKVGSMPTAADSLLLSSHIHSLQAWHRRWWLINSAISVPVLCLTFLPFVKMVLAWTCFRAVCHHRAHQALSSLHAWLAEPSFEVDQSVLQYEQSGQLDVLDKDVKECLVKHLHK